ncbi:MAG: DUF2085 domain-containing protein [Pyrinomonadaceae bacterium]|nr:DUF2085 domain-containing protein [Pyrinomonadaceae bacterium]MCX7639615.1 DUF2085 domain-containing protein [Pyrinomonadaceae bacterium]MDW8303367.1 DUF2085 domain-containing protein [Acidobacteriota bacterium]
MQNSLIKQRTKARKLAFFIWGSFVFVALTWNFLIFLAPIAAELRAEGLAKTIYGFFSYVCHQIENRSFTFHGHKLAVCSRCFGFYFSFLVGLFIYPLFFRRFDDAEPIPPFWLIIALIPIGLDWSLGVLGFWENTHLSRFTTGFILGFTCAICITPAFSEFAFFLVLREKAYQKLKFWKIL